MLRPEITITEDEMQSICHNVTKNDKPWLFYGTDKLDEIFCKFYNKEGWHYSGCDTRNPMIPVTLKFVGPYDQPHGVMGLVHPDKTIWDRVKDWWYMKKLKNRGGL